jgi:hypothetical protein
MNRSETEKRIFSLFCLEKATKIINSLIFVKNERILDRRRGKVQQFREKRAGWSLQCLRDISACSCLLLRSTSVRQAEEGSEGSWNAKELQLDQRCRLCVGIAGQSLCP